MKKSITTTEESMIIGADCGNECSETVVDRDGITFSPKYADLSGGCHDTDKQYLWAGFIDNDNTPKGIKRDLGATFAKIDKRNNGAIRTSVIAMIISLITVMLTLVLNGEDLLRNLNWLVSCLGQ